MHRRQFLSAASLAAGSLTIPAMSSSAVAARGVSIPPVPAQMAESLCENYMMNSKIFFANKVYGHTDGVIDLLRDLGVRSIRERITTNRSAGTNNQLYAMPQLAELGVRWHATVGLLENWPNATAVHRTVMDFIIANYRPAVGGDLTRLFHSFGGCNEVEGQGDALWATHARTMQRALFEQAGSRAATMAIPIAGPSTRSDITASKVAALGDLSAYCDVANGHLYNKGTSPTQNVDAHLQLLSPIFPGMSQTLMTETGYNNSVQDNKGASVPEFASAIYGVRGVCDYFKRNTVYGRFELLDDPDLIDTSSQAAINQTAEWESHFGIVAMTKGSVAESTPDTWRKKPEFYAMQSLLQILGDRGSSFTPEPLRVTVSGGGPDLQQLLLQKRNGKHYLVLWRDVAVCESFPSASVVEVAPVTVRIDLATARPFSIYCPTRPTALQRSSPSRTTLDVKVNGELKIIEIG